MQPEKPVPPKLVRPDNKHRVALGPITAGVSSYSVELQQHGVIVLRPNVELPVNEAWLWKNRAALESVRRGIEQASEGQLRERGSFAEYADEE
jgi:hypothetical protein